MLNLFMGWTCMVPLYLRLLKYGNLIIYEVYEGYDQWTPYPAVFVHVFILAHLSPRSASLYQHLTQWTPPNSTAWPSMEAWGSKDKILFSIYSSSHSRIFISDIFFPHFSSLMY